jgi:hypothetical protein
MMLFDPQFVRRLIGAVPLHVLRHPARATRWLEQCVAAGEAYAAALAQYPTVRVEPLNDHYACWQGLQALSTNAGLMNDVLAEGELGLLFSGLMLALGVRADTERFDALAATLRSPGVRWWSQRARAIHESSSSPADPADELVATFARQLRQLAPVRVVIPAALSREQLLARQAAVRAAYRETGAGHALAVLRQLGR